MVSCDYRRASDMKCLIVPHEYMPGKKKLRQICQLCAFGVSRNLLHDTSRWYCTQTLVVLSRYEIHLTKDATNNKPSTACSTATRA